jgi:large subunit ribosomal protein L25
MSALNAIKKFRLHELNGLRSHIKRFGPPTPLKPKPSGADSLLPTPEVGASGSSTSNATPMLPNPFLPRFNPQTGRWAPPKYSLRRQAELIKSAKACEAVHLLPPGAKLARPHLFSASNPPNVPINSEKDIKEEAHWAMPVLWDGDVKVKANAEHISKLYSGKKRMFKGHKWERTLGSRLKEREALMGSMKKRVRKYKAVCCVLLALSTPV